ncbi:MAG: glutamate cyclase domain-containing protein, partial [Candidatus Bipolaricaulia bacterium]
MKPEAHHLPSETFARIDELVCGVGHASAAVVARAREYQRALASLGPLCRVIASSLLKKPGARIGLFTGFVEPGSYPKGENDGPLGAAALARGLKLAGFRPTIHVDPEILETTRWLLAELGTEVAVREIEEVIHSRIHSIDAAIAIEKPGVNRAGILHTFDGKPIEGGSRSIDGLFLEMNRLGVPTVGIGDLGNEIGFGVLYDTVRRLD